MQQDWLNLPVIGQQLGVISVMLKADRKTAQTIGLHCVRCPVDGRGVCGRI